MSLQEEAAALYAVPLEEFAALRAARAKELRADDRALAQAVARLPKPSVAAAALNRLARERADLLDGLLHLGGQLREAQQAGDGARLRALTADAHASVREVLAALEERYAVSGAQLGQVEQTLRAAMADEGAAAAVRAGVLAKPLAPAGFGPVDLSGAVAVDLEPPGNAPRTRHLSVVRTAGERRKDAGAARRERQEQQDNAVRLAAEQALDALEQARAELATAAEELGHAEEARDAARDRVEELRASLREAEERASSGDAAVHAARRGLERAERNERAAMSAAEAARKDLEALS